MFTWYEATAERDAYPALTEKVECDVAVVGGGLAGLTVALELQRAGTSVCLLEADRIAWGASGRNGGFVSSGFALGSGEIEKAVGPHAAQELYQLSRIGTDFIRGTIQDHDASLKMGDGMIVAQRHTDDGRFRNHVESLAQQLNEPVTYLDRAQISELLDNDVYQCGLRNANAFHIHPLRYAILVARLAAKAGARVFEQSRALGVHRERNSWHVKTAKGEVQAKDVVYCVSSLDRKIHAATGRAILPVSTYVAVTEPSQQRAIRTSAAIADTRRAGDYYRLVGEGRVLWGGRITTQISEPSRLAEKMRGDMVGLYPALSSLKMEHAWAGLMGYALHKMPLIGTDGHGQWFATGFGGHGLNATAMAGHLIASAIARQDDRYRQFTPFAPRWAFGQLGRLGVQGSYWWMQMRDRVAEHKTNRG